MRLIVCALAVALAGGASNALAQARHVGLKAGINVASLSFEGDNVDAYDDRRIGFLAGGFVVVPVSGPAALQVEALFSQKGAKFSDDVEELEGTLELDYLDIPVMLRLQGPAIGSTRLHVFGGPSIAYRMSARSTLSNTAFEFQQGSINSIEDDIELFDFGIVAGAGADIGRRLVVEARYSWGLGAINKDTSDGFEIRNRALSIMAGVRF
jgi:hypothetical protein